MRDHEYYQTHQGLWCNVCGEHVSSKDDLEDDDYDPPENCPNCGFPDDFEPDAI